jgi:hypothetical protein
MVQEREYSSRDCWDKNKEGPLHITCDRIVHMRATFPFLCLSCNTITAFSIVSSLCCKAMQDMSQAGGTYCCLNTIGQVCVIRVGDETRMLNGDWVHKRRQRWNYICCAMAVERNHVWMW